MRLVKVSDAFVRLRTSSNQISEVVRVKIIILMVVSFSRIRMDIEIFVY